MFYLFDPAALSYCHVHCQSNPSPITKVFLFMLSQIWLNVCFYLTIKCIHDALLLCALSMKGSCVSVALWKSRGYWDLIKSFLGVSSMKRLDCLYSGQAGLFPREKDIRKRACPAFSPFSFLASHLTTPICCLPWDSLRHRAFFRRLI